MQTKTYDFSNQNADQRGRSLIRMMAIEAGLPQAKQLIYEQIIALGRSMVHEKQTPLKKVQIEHHANGNVSNAVTTWTTPAQEHVLVLASMIRELPVCFPGITRASPKPDSQTGHDAS
jgi:hypothetical protein